MGTLPNTEDLHVELGSIGIADSGYDWKPIISGVEHFELYPSLLLGNCLVVAIIYNDMWPAVPILLSAVSVVKLHPYHGRLHHKTLGLRTQRVFPPGNSLVFPFFNGGFEGGWV